MTEDSFQRAAHHDRQAAAARTGFRIHFGVYLAVQALLIAIWATTPHGGGGVPWFVYPLLGWGIGLVAHFIAMRGSANRQP